MGLHPGAADLQDLREVEVVDDGAAISTADVIDQAVEPAAEVDDGGARMIAQIAADLGDGSQVAQGVDRRGHLPHVLVLDVGAVRFGQCDYALGPRILEAGRPGARGPSASQQGKEKRLLNVIIAHSSHYRECDGRAARQARQA